MREVIPLYKSVYKGIRDLDAETFKRLMIALMEYGFEEVSPELSGLELAVFESWRANIDARSRDKDNGKRGGRPSKNPGSDSENPGYEIENPGLANENPGLESENHITETKTETETETKTKTKTEKDPKHKHGRYSHVLLTEKEYAALAKDYGESQAKAAIDYLDEYIERKGYTTKSHYLAIRKWVFDAMREESIKQQELKQRETRLRGLSPQAAARQGIQRGTDYNALMLDRITTELAGGG